MNFSSSTGIDAAPGTVGSGGSIAGATVPFSDLAPEITESGSDNFPLNSGTKVTAQVKAETLPTLESSSISAAGLGERGSVKAPLINSSTLRAESPFAGVFGPTRTLRQTSRERDRAVAAPPASVDVTGVNFDLDIGDMFTLPDQEQEAQAKKLLTAAFCRLRPDIGQLIYDKSKLDIFDIVTMLQSKDLLKTHVDKIASTIDSDAKSIEDKKRNVEHVAPPVSQPPSSWRQGTPPRMDANGRSSRTASPRPADPETQA